MKPAERRAPRPCGCWRSERGAAVIEFTILVTLVLVPIVYVVLAVMQVQAAAFAVTQAAREAGRAFAQADSIAQAKSDAAAAVELALSDQGFTVGRDTLQIECSTRGCLAPGSQVTILIDLPVRLPFLPDAIGDATIARVPVSAEHRIVIDAYRGES